MITAWFTPSEAHPGDTVEMTITFTNPEQVDVIFAYLGLAETYDSRRGSGASGRPASAA